MAKYSLPEPSELMPPPPPVAVAKKKPNLLGVFVDVMSELMERVFCSLCVVNHLSVEKAYALVSLDRYKLELRCFVSYSYNTLIFCCLFVSSSSLVVNDMLCGMRIKRAHYSRTAIISASCFLFTMYTY